MSGAFPSPDPSRGSQTGGLGLEYQTTPTHSGPGDLRNQSATSPGDFTGGVVPSAGSVSIADPNYPPASVAPDEEDDSFNNRPPSKWVVFIGLGAAIALAVVCFWSLYTESRGQHPPDTVISVFNGGPAYEGAVTVVEGHQDNKAPVHLETEYHDNVKHSLRMFLHAGVYRVYLEFPNRAGRVEVPGEFKIGPNKAAQSGRVELPTTPKPTTRGT